jgi:adenylate cyclase
MNIRSRDQLLKQIAHLAKQNRELEKKVLELERQSIMLLKKNEKYRLALEKHKLKTEEDEETESSAKFNVATVLFADIKGFSKVVQQMDSSKLMDELDEILFEFDNIIGRYHIHKIKTIGDTYMCVGGIPEKNNTNPVQVVMAAMEMRNFLDEFEAARRGREKIWELKIGIHTGPVAATISGKKKVNYDVRGETVNISSRIEAVSARGNVLISAMTYELVKEFFSCSLLGKLPVKYMGDIPMYQVNGILPELSIRARGMKPNDLFHTKFGLIRFYDIQEVILDRLEKELPDYLHYHNVKHTVDVVTEVELIGWAEGCNDEEILLLKTAALFHDLGFIVEYDNHEYNGTVIAREMLPRYDYNPEQIEKICRLIFSTKMPPSPEGLLEEIICDSDLDYLGRSDFIPVSNTLYHELKSQNKIGSINDWNKLQIKFISGHQYFTATARSLREVNKQLQIERLSSLIE